MSDNNNIARKINKLRAYNQIYFTSFSVNPSSIKGALNTEKNVPISIAKKKHNNNS